MTPLIPENLMINAVEMAESAKVKLYQFEPTAPASYSDDVSDLDESDTDIREQVSFTERLGRMDWCSCARCVSMPRGIECQCCREMESVQERLMEQENTECITCHDQFPIVCLNKDVLYTALVINRERREPIHLPLSNR